MRPADDAWWEAIERLVELGDLRGRRVLDVGCGTGRFAAALTERWACKVWGVDPTPEMLAVARERLPRAVALRRARAEELPFREGWFERVTMTLVLQHTDRPRALAEALRVLSPGGRLGILTFDHAQFDRYYLNACFPSLADADRRRFPSRTALEEELAAAGFGGVHAELLHQERELDRETALRRIAGKHISTFQLIGDEEYEAGLERARRELPERIRYANDFLLLIASRP